MTPLTDARNTRRLLMVGDDGLAARGATACLEACAVEWDIVQIGASRSYGGSGTSCYAAAVAPRPLDVERRRWLVDQSPATSVVLAVAGVVGHRPNLVVAGVNEGPNVGLAALHSGTVGAALTAGNLGVSAVAVSLDDEYSLRDEHCGDVGYDAAAIAARAALQELDSLPSGTVLNVNVPGVPRELISGVAAAEIDVDAELATDVLRERSADHERDTRSPITTSTDVALLRAGWITVSQLVVLRRAPTIDLGRVVVALQRTLSEFGFFTVGGDDAR